VCPVGLGALNAVRPTSARVRFKDTANVPRAQGRHGDATANLLEAYDSFSELAVACEEATERSNSRPQMDIRRFSNDAHPVPQTPRTVA
jgi:hypothetical protein